MEKTIDEPQVKTKKPALDLIKLGSKVAREACSKLLIKSVNIVDGTITFINDEGKEQTATTNEKVLFLKNNGKSPVDFGTPLIHVDIIEHKFNETYFDFDAETYRKKKVVQINVNYSIYFVKRNDNCTRLHSANLVSTSTIASPRIIKNECHFDAIPRNSIKEYLKQFSKPECEYEDSFTKLEYSDNLGEKILSSYIIYKDKIVDVEDIGKGELIENGETLYIGYHNLKEDELSHFVHQTYKDKKEIRKYCEDKSKGLSSPYVKAHQNCYKNYYPTILHKTKGLTGLVTKDVFTRAKSKDLAFSYVNTQIDYDSERIYVSTLFNTPISVPHFDCCGAYQAYKHNNLGWFNDPENVLKEKMAAKLYLVFMQDSKADRFIYLTNVQVKDALKFYNIIYGEDNIVKLTDYTNVNSGNTINVYQIISHNRFIPFSEYSIDNERWRFTSDIDSGAIPAPYFVRHQWIKNSEDTKQKKKSKTSKTSKPPKGTETIGTPGIFEQIQQNGYVWPVQGRRVRQEGRRSAIFRRRT